MDIIRRWLLTAFTTVVLVGTPILHNPVTSAPAQPQYQMVCSSGSSCGSCC